MPENVFLVRVEARDTGSLYRYLVCIECGLHQLAKHDCAQQFAKSTFLAKYSSLRQITIYIPEPYRGEDLSSLPKMDQGCGCWVVEI
ncbi:MAG: hypothetical protein JO170_06195 [Verrucomicrobia bacterium]|nr:hypothetical protein [Verrucomicrobiota bacterium]